MTSKKNISGSGFTLIEMVIAMSVLALVVLILYLAFANAGRIWRRQQLVSDQGEREVALLRLLHDDLFQFKPYTCKNERGQAFYFAVGERVIFYATSAAYGARERRPAGLYFVCCYLDEDPDGEGLNFYLVKEFGPKLYLLEDFWSFREQGQLLLSEALREAALPVLRGLETASFQVVLDAEKLHLPEGEVDEGALMDKKDMRVSWNEKNLPKALLLTYKLPSRGQRRLLLPLEPPPSKSETKAKK